MSRTILLFVAALPVLVGATVARADARTDLGAGEAALAAGDYQRALTLLEQAAVELPDSVEAQFALARAQIHVGQLDKARDRLARVLRLSPDHPAAKKLSDALAGRRETAEGKLAFARVLMDTGLHSQAVGVLDDLVKGPYAESVQLDARLGLAEARVMQRYDYTHLAEVLQVIEQVRGTPREGRARVLAAMCLATNRSEQSIAQSRAMLDAAGDLPEPWSHWAELVRLSLGLDDATAAAASTRLVGLLPQLPPGNYRVRIINRLADELRRLADIRAGGGDLDGALAILRPMVTTAAPQDLRHGLRADVPAPGWFVAAGQATGQATLEQLTELVNTLTSVARLDVEQNRHRAELHALDLAMMLLDGVADAFDPLNMMHRRLELVGQAALLSVPAPGRRPGTPLSSADTFCRIALTNLAPRAFEPRLQQTVFAQAKGLLDRYASAGDVETGLGMLRAGDELAAESLCAIRLPKGPARDKLLVMVAGHYASLGAKAFAEAAASTTVGDPAANSKLNLDDQRALTLYAEMESARSAGDAAVNRYVSAEQWDAAEAGIRLLYREAPASTLGWRLVGLNLHRARVEMSAKLAAHRRIDGLPAPLAVALARAGELVEADTSDDAAAPAEQMAEPIIAALIALDRADLAGAVITDLAGPNGSPKLAEWALLTRARMAGIEASQTLAVFVNAEDGRDVALQTGHQREVALLGEMVAKFPNSPRGGVAVARVAEIAAIYSAHKAFDVADKVLADFLKAHPKLRKADELAWARVQVAMSRAADVFARRPAADGPPTKLSDEYTAALAMVADFLKAHPQGPLAGNAEAQMLAIARVYGSAGAWGVSRQVLDRFAAAVPDFRDPAQQKLWQAATWLGELQAGHGLSLLTPPATPALGGSWDEYKRSRAGDKLDDLYAYDRDDGRDEVNARMDIEFTPDEPQPGGSGGGGGPGGEYAQRWKELGGGRGNWESETSSNSLQPARQSSGSTSTATPAPAPPAVDPGRIHDIPGQQLAAIRQAEQQRLSRIAQMEGQQQGQAGPRVINPAPDSGVVLPGGAVLSEEAMKKQDAASDAAYGILIELVKQMPGKPHGQRARGEILWMVGFFEGQLRPDRAVALIGQLLTDRPRDAERIALAYRALGDRVVHAAQRNSGERIDQAWVDARHERFEAARAAIDAFLKTHADQKPWNFRAMQLRVETFVTEASLAGQVSRARAGGLLARAADEVIALALNQPEHPDRSSFANRLWQIADQLTALGQRDQALYVLGRIPVRFPTDGLAVQSLQRMAGLYAQDLSAPLRAVETWQEFLALGGDSGTVQAQVFSIAQQLAARQRYVEALHVYGVFVDSFPTDARAPQALQAIGQIHQTNEAFGEAIAAYQRILDEYAGNGVVAAVKFQIAECHIHRSQWREARQIYADAVAAGQGGQIELARQRIEVLKSLSRYQTLLADDQVTRNKDSAQFEIGRIVLERLGNRVKAVEEFTKVVAGHPGSHLADDAQFEIGKALMDLGRLDEARAALMTVATKYPNSPLADDALYRVGQSYEQQARQLASVTLERAREIAFEAGQRGAYQKQQQRMQSQSEVNAKKLEELRSEGKGKEADLAEAYQGYRFNDYAELSNVARLAEQEAETESALAVANRQDRINEAYRNAVAVYKRAADEHPLGDATDESLLRMASIFETQLKDRKAAMETYQKVVKFFPGTPVAENAAWKVATFYEAEGNFAEAVNAYREFIRTYPASGRVADAQYAMAEALEQLGRWVEAMDAYQTFRDKFAQHPKAPAAADQIQWIRAYRMK